MNIAFSKLIKINERLWEFNFRKRPADQLFFHGDVPDSKGGRFLFSIFQLEPGIWRIEGQSLPISIIAAENIIGQSIEEEMLAIKHSVKKLY